MSLPRAHATTHDHHPDATVTLSYEARFLRRRTLETDQGERFLVDLAQTTSLGAGDAFVLDDGRKVGVVAAPEALIEVTGGDLVRLAWHIGNRHTPAQIEPARILIQHDHVMADMLARLGASVRDVTEPFTPEGGAYGHGRTHGHDHGASHGPESHHHHDHDH
ncbi:MAG: urease accessory protein UreE [Maritimibacter sp.]|nr:urease accessory protein UreE [Maritimibacter sp.]